MSWVGWFRPHAGGPWQRLAEGDTLEACHRHLLAQAKRLGLQGGDRLMTSGRHPADVLAGRRPGHERMMD